MTTIAVLLTLHIPAAQGLKEKRAVVRSLVERLRTRQRLSAAEVGLQDRVQAAQIGFAIVSGDLGTARRVLDETRRFVDGELLGKAEVIDAQIEEIALGD